MNKLGKADWLLIAGAIGVAVLVGVVYVQPSAMNDLQLEDLSPIGISIKVGALLSIAGLLAFFDGMPESLLNTSRNVCRMTYAAGFGVASYCSGNDWQCFFSP